MERMVDVQAEMAQVGLGKDRAPIVCATRGGEGSRDVRARAVRRAREEERPLVFLYIADAQIVSTKGGGSGGLGLSQAIRHELAWIGRVLLRLARLQAARMGVEADVQIREGRVVPEIVRFVHETDAAALMLGAPRGTTSDVFGDDPVEHLAEAVRKDTGIDVEIVRPEEAVHTSAEG